MTDHARFREWSAGYVLGALDPEDRALFESHLAMCEKCRADVAAFAPLPGLLNRSDVDAGAAPQNIADRAIAAIASEWTKLARSRRRWQRVAGVAAVLLAFALVLPALSNDEPETGRSIALVPQSTASGTVEIVPKAWGTAVHIELRNLPQSDTYFAWAVSADGDWEPVATWGPTPSLGAKVDGASSIPTDQLNEVIITTADRANRLGVAPVALPADG